MLRLLDSLFRHFTSPPLPASAPAPARPPARKHAPARTPDEAVRRMKGAATRVETAANEAEACAFGANGGVVAGKQAKYAAAASRHLKSAETSYRTFREAYLQGVADDRAAVQADRAKKALDRARASARLAVEGMERIRFVPDDSGPARSGEQSYLIEIDGGRIGQALAAPADTGGDPRSRYYTHHLGPVPPRHDLHRYWRLTCSLDSPTAPAPPEICDGPKRAALAHLRMFLHAKVIEAARPPDADDLDGPR